MTTDHRQPECQPVKRSAASGQPAHHRPATIDDLPDELIIKILAQSKVCGCGAYIFPHVNQRYRRLFAQATAIWRDTSLCAWRDGPRRRGSNAADHTLRRLEWLSPRATAIQNIDLHGWAGPQADQLFATLTGMLTAGDPVLRISAYDCEFTGRAFDSLLLLPKLQALELGPVGGSVESEHLGMLLGSLRHLTSLDLDFEWTEKGSVKGGFPTGLLDCTRLRRLCLSNAGDAAFRALPPAISQLRDLDHLILYDCGVAKVPVELSCLTKLTRLGVFQFQGPAADVCPLMLPQAMTALKSLRELGLSLPVWQPILKPLSSQLTRLMVRHISSHAEAQKFGSAFWHLQAAKTLELSSDTDLATDSKDAFQGSIADDVADSLARCKRLRADQQRRCKELATYIANCIKVHGPQCLRCTYSTVTHVTASRSRCTAVRNPSRFTITGRNPVPRPGFQLNGKDAVKCPAGHYKASAGTQKCALCTGRGYQPLRGQLRCKACPAGRFINNARTRCNTAGAGVEQGQTSTCTAKNDGTVCRVDEEYRYAAVRIFAVNKISANAGYKLRNICSAAGATRNLTLGLVAFDLIPGGGSKPRFFSGQSQRIAQVALPCVQCSLQDHYKVVWTGSARFSPNFYASLVVERFNSFDDLGQEIQSLYPEQLPVLCAECNVSDCFSCYAETGACAFCMRGFTLNTDTNACDSSSDPPQPNNPAY